MPYKNPWQQRQFQAEWARKNRDAFPEKAREKRAILYEASISAINQFKFSGCQACGEKRIQCLDLHHIDPSQKEHNVSRMIRDRLSVQAISKELEKCAVLCANCHRLFHAGMIDLHGQPIGEGSCL